ncbi:MAG: peptidase domain-containing ABC transporter [Bacilli bacterium]|nr:peptidase domain-containing ABC transporter [Bacilli bacterium]
MRKHPIILQEDNKDCGVACLSMIIKHYRGYIPYEELKDNLGVNKDGVSATRIIEVAKKYGFEAKGIEGSFEEFQKEMIILPCIAHVLLENAYYHYLVIYEINIQRKYLIVGDPAKGIYKMNFEKFEQIWQHVILTFYPKVPIPYNEPNNLLKKQFLLLLKKEKKPFFTMIYLSIFVTIFSILFSFMLEHFISLLNEHDETTYLLCSVFLYVSFLLLKNGSSFLRNKIFFHVYQRVDFKFMRLIIGEILHLPYRYFKNRTTGEIISRIGDIGIIRSFLSAVTLSSLMDFPLLLISGIVLYFISNKLFFVSLFTLFFYIILFIIYQKRIASKIEAVEENNSLVTSYMVETLGGYETVFGSHLKEETKEEIMRRYMNYMEGVKSLEYVQNESGILEQSLYEFSVLAFLALGIYLVAKEELTISALLLFHSLFMYFIEPVRNFLKLGEEFKKVKISWRRLSNLFCETKELGIYNKNLEGTIEFKHLTFSYLEQPILKNASFHIKKGSKVLLVGESGNGKSTILKLLMKYYEAPRNSLFLDGIDMSEYKKEVIKNNILYVSMKEQLWTGPVFENILLGKEPNHRYQEILKLTEVDSILSKNPLGHRMVLEENGANLSGGEKQRVVLARTLLLPFSILLLDEATSQIDSDMERRILKRLFKKYPNRTMIMVSHRLDNLDLFDQKIEIRNGYILEDVRKHE